MRAQLLLWSILNVSTITFAIPLRIREIDTNSLRSLEEGLQTLKGDIQEYIKESRELILNTDYIDQLISMMSDEVVNNQGDKNTEPEIGLASMAKDYLKFLEGYPKNSQPDEDIGNIEYSPLSRPQEHDVNIHFDQTEEDLHETPMFERGKRSGFVVPEALVKTFDKWYIAQLQEEEKKLEEEKDEDSQEKYHNSWSEDWNPSYSPSTDNEHKPANGILDSLFKETENSRGSSKENISPLKDKVEEEEDQDGDFENGDVYLGPPQLVRVGSDVVIDTNLAWGTESPEKLASPRSIADIDTAVEGAKKVKEKVAGGGVRNIGAMYDRNGYVGWGQDDQNI